MLTALPSGYWPVAETYLSRYQHSTGLVTLSNYQVIFSYSYYASLSFICQETFTLLLYAQSQYYQIIYKQQMYE